MRDLLKGYSVAITGATGWLGKALIDMLPDKMPFYAFDSRNIHELKNLPKGKWLLAHCAYQGMERMKEKTYQSVSDSLTDEVSEAIRIIKPEAIMFPSSGAVYIEGNLYGQQKLKDEAHFTAMAGLVGAKIVIPRIFNISGIYMNKLETYALSNMICGAMAGKIDVYSPESLRSYVDVQDVLEVSLNWLMNGEPTMPFDTRGEDVSMLDLAEIVGDIIGKPGMIKVHGEPAYHYMGKSEPMGALCRRYGVELFDLERQIIETYSYIRGIQ